MVKLLVALLALAAISLKDDVTFPIKNRRASAISIQLQKLLGTETGLDADDLAGVIRVYGTEEAIVEARKFIAMFDVKPRHVVTKWSFSESVDKVEFDGSTRIRNSACSLIPIVKLNLQCQLRLELTLRKLTR